MKHLLKSSYMSIVLMLLYVPLFVFMVMSFSGGDSITNFTHFSFRWYAELFRNSPLLNSIMVSIMIALFTAIISVIIALFAAIGLSKSRKLTQKMSLSINNIPLINADIVTAIALMLLFLLFGFHFGIGTLLLAHISFDVPYAMLIIMPQLRKIDQNIIKSSLDLGARPIQTLWRIIIPKLKTALLSAFVIGFAMSFDDFLISYFNSGAVTNISVFIYSQKKIKLYVNAFGTLFVAVLAVSLFSWNLGKLMHKKRVKFRKELINNTYKDRDIARWEQKLNKYYYYWNHYRQATKAKQWFKAIQKYEQKIIIDQKWIWTQTQKIKLKQAHQEILAAKERQKYWWWNYNWKKLLLLAIIVTAIALLTAFYIMNGVYDLKVANWSDYIAPGLIQQFEDKYHVKVLYTPYNSNESLYNKLYTTSYDVMVPSDYMVKKLATEGRLAPINYKLLNEVNPNYHIYKPDDNLPANPNQYQIDTAYEAKTYPKAWTQKYWDSKNQRPKITDFTKGAYVEPTLLNTMRKNNWKDAQSNPTNILKYSIPYIWGDLRLVANLNSDQNKAWLQSQNVAVQQYEEGGITNYDVANPQQLSWNILWKAAAAGKKILLNDDYKNLFMLANQRNFGTEQPANFAQEQADVAALKTLFSYHNVAIQDDEISNTVGDGDFDFAFMYNGDLLEGQTTYFEDHPETAKFLATIPRENNEGTNIYSDNLVLNKKDANNKLAYEFINFMIQHQPASINYLQYTSPWHQLNSALLGTTKNPHIKPSMQKYAKDYVPVPKRGPKQGGYYTYSTALQKNDQPFLVGSLDEQMLNDYNKLIAERN